MKTREEITTMKLIKFHVNVIGGLTIFFFIASTAIGWALAEMNQRGITEQQIKDAAKDKHSDGTFSIVDKDGSVVNFREENGQIKVADDLNQGGMNVVVNLLNHARGGNWDLVENGLNGVPVDQQRVIARQFLFEAQDAGIDAKNIPGNIFRLAGIPLVGGGLGDEDAAITAAEAIVNQLQGITKEQIDSVIDEKINPNALPYVISSLVTNPGRSVGTLKDNQALLVSYKTPAILPDGSASSVAVAVREASKKNKPIIVVDTTPGTTEIQVREHFGIVGYSNTLYLYSDIASITPQGIGNIEFGKVLAMVDSQNQESIRKKMQGVLILGIGNDGKITYHQVRILLGNA